MALVDLGAGGTVERPYIIGMPGLGRRIRLAIELALIFIGAPLAIIFAIHELRLPLFIVLQPVFIGFIAYLLWDRTFLVKRELRRGFGWRDAVKILLTFVIAGGLTALVMWRFFPSNFLEFPRRVPQLWLIVMMLYPLLSVLPQELVYRTFYFHRYGPLFGNRRWLAIAVNAALFGFGHIMFGNWVAVVGSVLGGLLFAYRYDVTRSLWAVWFEHSLYGCLVFTVGLGGYFFTGIAL
jgi:CAAX protease family protein